MKRRMFPEAAESRPLPTLPASNVARVDIDRVRDALSIFEGNILDKVPRARR